MMNNQIKQAKENVTVEKWKRRITDFNQSGMTVSERCKVNNVGVSTFYKYQRQIRMELLADNSLPAKSNHNISFVPVASDITAGIPVYITKGDIKIEVNSRSDMDTVVEMIRVLLC